MVICDFEGYTEFADLTKLPKKMIIKSRINWDRKDFEKLPDISESIVYGNFICWRCDNLISAKGLPAKIGGKTECDKMFNMAIDLECAKNSLLFPKPFNRN